MSAAQAYEQMQQIEAKLDEPAVENSEQLLLEQLPQVKYIARRIHERLPQHVPFDDLLHAGIVGLIDAMHKYDASKNVRFASYAKFRIRGAILDSLRDMDWSPRDLRRKARRLEATMQKLQTELGHSATEPELAEAMGMTLEEFQHMLNEIRGLEVGSLQIESLEDGRETDLSENIAGPPDQDPLSLYMRTERKQMLAQAIARLPEREQQVLALYYQEELTMKEVGAVLGVGESRVSQIHSVAVARLRASLSNAQESQRRAAALPALSGEDEREAESWKKS
jgi:RNA polymerase sigma factor for flagellar operon FliA